ncbi:MAG TPA: biliverdin-producing heme oxygenase, partial [Bacillota bacterium]|nr:biliverdin-producing heme oxygenase [Bacillota bacterium]
GDLSQVLESLPHCRALPPVTQCAEALGTLYVIEGATLGGQFIARHLAARFGLTPANGAAFFHSYGLQVGPRWQQFRAFLVSASAELEQERATIIASAQRTFQALDDWLFPHV